MCCYLLREPVVSSSLKIAGDNFDEAIIRYMRKKHNVLIGERTAEDLKVNVGTAFKRPKPVSMEVREETYYRTS